MQAKGRINLTHNVAPVSKQWPAVWYWKHAR